MEFSSFNVDVNFTKHHVVSQYGWCSGSFMPVSPQSPTLNSPVLTERPGRRRDRTGRGGRRAGRLHKQTSSKLEQGMEKEEEEEEEEKRGA